jgi:hypothetical protein
MSYRTLIIFQDTESSIGINVGWSNRMIHFSSKPNDSWPVQEHTCLNVFQQSMTRPTNDVPVSPIHYESIDVLNRRKLVQE